MGGSQSEEFMVYTPCWRGIKSSAARIASTQRNLEKGKRRGSKQFRILAPEGDGKPLEVQHAGTEDYRRRSRVFLGVSPKSKIKTLALMIDSAIGGKHGRGTPRRLQESALMHALLSFSCAAIIS